MRSKCCDARMVIPDNPGSNSSLIYSNCGLKSPRVVQNNQPAPTADDKLNITFQNKAPEDSEWSAYIKILNEYTTPNRYLRSILQYARSGDFQPADMHVDLIEQFIKRREQTLLAEIETTMDSLEMDLKGYLGPEDYVPGNDLRTALTKIKEKHGL